MACQVFFEFRIKHDGVEKLRNWLRTILPDTRAYDGCISIQATQDQDDPTRFTFVEQWESRKHFEKYRQWRLDSGVLTDIEDVLDGDPSWRFFDYFGV